MSSAVLGAPSGATVRLPSRTRTVAFRTTAPRVCVHRVAIDNAYLGSSLQSSGSVSQMFMSMPQRSRGNRMVTAMAGKVTGKIKLSLTAGKANPAPPVGPALGSKGVNIMSFCKEYNAATAKMAGQVVPVEITVYEDRSFTFILKTPPASVLLKLAAGVEKGSGKPNKDKVGKVTKAQVLEIAQRKMADTNTNRIESVCKMIEGTAKTIGLVVVD